MENLMSLPYYPYSAIGLAVVILLLLVALMASSRKRRYSAPQSKPYRPSGARVVGMPVDGLSSFGEFDDKPDKPDKPMEMVVIPAAPIAPIHEPPKQAVDPALIEQAIKACQEKFQEIYIEMYIGLGLMSDFERLRTEVGHRLKDGQETHHVMTELKMTPEGVILMQMASVAGILLQSGEHHVGKGLLGIHGQELFSVYRYALNTMLEKGFASQDETHGKLSFMEKKVQELGE